MGGGPSHFPLSGFYVVKRVPKHWETWDDIPACWTFSAQDAAHDIDSWDFNIWDLDVQHLFTLSFLIIKAHNFHTLFSIRTDTWYNLMCEVQALMSSHTNPYHNFYHVLDVMQTSHCFLSTFGGRAWLSDIQRFSVLIAALIHDLEHDGLNNMYQVNASTVLALRYNDNAVLENHHCSRAFELFSQPSLNVFAGLAQEQRKVCRKYIIAMVLGTDMTAHFALKEELDGCVGRLLSQPQAAPRVEDKDALTVMKAIVHTADISNPAKRWELSKKWSDRVVEEFFVQGDRERREGLPVSPNCDRGATRQDELSINFTDFIVAPFFFSITRLLPKTLRACRALEDNRDAWNGLLRHRLAAATESEAKVDEVLGKWETRRADFTEKMKDLQANAAGRGV